MVQYKGSVYELFEFVRGGEYDKSIEATADAGATLCRFHSLLSDYKPHYQPPRGTYHGAQVVLDANQKLPELLIRQENGRPAVNEVQVQDLVDGLDGFLP